MDSRKAKYNNEDLVFIKDQSEGCSGCRFAEDDVVYEGKVLFQGCDKGICKKYPDQKPLAVMDGKESCAYKALK